MSSAVSWQAASANAATTAMRIVMMRFIVSCLHVHRLTESITRATQKSTLPYAS